MSYIGTNKVGKMYLGSTEISKAYLGSELVYQNTPSPTYIQDGLVFHLDCADATTTQWADKIGNIIFTMNNVSIGSDGGVYFNGSSAYGNYSGTLDFPYTTHSIEVAFKNDKSSANSILFMINATNKVAFGYSAANCIIAKSGNSNAKTAYQTSTGKHIITVTPSTAYDNGNAMVNYGADTWYLRTGGTFVGSRSASENFFKGTIYQIRVYNRALTVDEITYNHAIDMAKYNIT